MKVTLKGTVVFIEKGVEKTFKNDDGTSRQKKFDVFTIQQENGEQAKVKTACNEFDKQVQYKPITMDANVSHWKFNNMSGMSWVTDKYKGA